jgi:hypothetical protein
MWIEKNNAAHFGLSTFSIVYSVVREIVPQQSSTRPADFNCL